MGLLALTLLAAAADPDTGLGKKLLPIYVKDAEAYSIAVESEPKKALELKKEPVLEWVNPARGGGQHGAVYLWLRDGRPAALACIFSDQHARFPGRQINHELHALDREKLVVTRDAYNQWKPQAGLERKELADSGVPAETPGARLIQMKKLAQEFTGHTTDRDAKRWDLRLLPAPLYRYPTAKTGVIDGALFALVSEAGTDPEVLLVIEAKETGGKVRWEYACGRFSDLELRVNRKDKEVYSSVPGDKNPFTNDPLHLYRLYQEKIVSPEGKLLARIRQTPQAWWGEVIPVEDK
jgi:hypothetical protein